MRIRKPRTRWLVLTAILAVVVVSSVRIADRPMPIDSYRLLDPATIGIETITGPGSWTRITVVTETASSVTVTVSSLQAPLPGDDVGHFLELAVKLGAQLGTRAVIDGSDGITVPRTTCPPIMWAAGTCSDGD
jgi:hypothetical protein